MELPAEGFDWDDGNREKCRKHGLSVEEIESVLSGTPKIAPDVLHSRTEERFLAVGRNTNGRPVFVVFTVRRSEGRWLIRPISARYMHEKEIKGYEEESSDLQD